MPIPVVSNVDAVLKQRTKAGPGWHAACPDCFWMIVPGKDSFASLKEAEEGDHVKVDPDGCWVCPQCKGRMILGTIA